MLQYPRDGVSTVLASEKPIVRSPAPQRFSQELLARISHRDRTLLRGRAAQNQRRRRLSLASQYSWSTTSGEAAAEGCLPTPKYPVPVTTLERHADPVTRRGKYLGSTEPSLWQQFAREWDMLQARCPMKPMTKPGIKLLVYINYTHANQKFLIGPRFLRNCRTNSKLQKCVSLHQMNIWRKLGRLYYNS